MVECVNELLDSILDFIQSVPPVARTIIAGVAIMLETSVLIGLIVPGDTVVLMASTAVSSPLEWLATVIAVIAGALVGESLGFLLGRLFGPRIRASRVGRWIGEKNWERADRYVKRRGGIAVFISRFLPVLHSLVPMTAGMTVMRYRTFIAWTVPACIIWALGYVTVGALAAEGYREASGRLGGAGFIFVGIILVFLFLVYLSKKLLQRVERRHLEESAPETGPAHEGGAADGTDGSDASDTTDPASQTAKGRD